MRCLNYVEKLLTQECWYIGPPIRTGYGSYKYITPVKLRCRIERNQQIDSSPVLDYEKHSSIGFFSTKIVVDSFIYDGSLSIEDVVHDPENRDRMRIMSVTKITDLSSDSINLYEAKMI